MHAITRAGSVRTISILLMVVSACSGPTATPLSPPDPNDGILDTPEQPAFIRDRGQGIPLPPTGSWDPLIQDVQDSPASMEETGFLDMMAYNASCQWYVYYLDATGNGDQEATNQAGAMIAEIPTWPQFSGGTGVFQEIADEVALGATDELRAQVEINC